MKTTTTQPKGSPASDLLGIVDPVPLDQDAECVGCGDAKRYRGDLAESLVCCRKCWRRLPKWVKDGFIHDHGAGMIWQNRISVLLQWMRESDGLPNDKLCQQGAVTTKES